MVMYTNNVDLINSFTDLFFPTDVKFNYSSTKEFIVKLYSFLNINENKKRNLYSMKANLFSFSKNKPDTFSNKIETTYCI